MEIGKIAQVYCELLRLAASQMVQIIGAGLVRRVFEQTLRGQDRFQQQALESCGLKPDKVMLELSLWKKSIYRDRVMQLIS